MSPLLDSRIPMAIRLLLTLALLALIAGVAARPVPAWAEARDPRDPDARLQVIVKSITVHDSQDFLSDGEFEFYADVSIVIPACAKLRESTSTCNFLATTGAFRFSGGENDVISIERALPGPDSRNDAAEGVSPESGIPVWSGKTYRVQIAGTEIDPGTLKDDDAGMLVWDLSAENSWELGAWTERTVTKEAYLAASGGKAGPTSVSMEIRRMPLPDLTGTDLQISFLPILSGTHELCVPVRNSGSRPANGFQVTFRMNGQVLPGGVVDDSRTLQPGGTVTTCAMTELPSSGSYKITATIDDARKIPEEDELNNSVSASYVATQATPAATPTPASTAADLIVTAIAVDGEASTPQPYCEAGKNEVIVTVKNTGTQPAGPFVTRLTVDGDDDFDKRVNGLAAGASLDVAFDKVKLKKGSRSLLATADAKHQVTESNEGNNTKTLTVSCKEE